MVNLKRLFALLRARNREFLRERTALLWNVILPVVIVFGFAYAFNKEEVQVFKVGLVASEAAPLAPSGFSPFLATRHIQFIPQSDIPQAILQVERHQLDMLLNPMDGGYWINEKSPKGYIAERLLLAQVADARRQTVTGERIRYVDWLIPGVLGMNVMFSSLFGVGYAIVRYRKNGVLKRLKATPLTPLEFLAAQVASRLWLILLTTVLVYLGTDLFVGFSMYGSHLLLLITLISGTLAMISLALIVAARLANQEAANGILNLISWPMMLLSGVWFSLEGSPQWVQQLAQLLPLTHLIDAARKIMIDGAGFAEIAPHLVILLGMTLVFLVLSARWFRWE